MMLSRCSFQLDRGPCMWLTRKPMKVSRVQHLVETNWFRLSEWKCSFSKFATMYRMISQTCHVIKWRTLLAYTFLTCGHVFFNYKCPWVASFRHIEAVHYLVLFSPQHQYDFTSILFKKMTHLGAESDLEDGDFFGWNLHSPWPRSTNQASNFDEEEIKPPSTSLCLLHQTRRRLDDLKVLYLGSAVRRKAHKTILIGSLVEYRVWALRKIDRTWYGISHGGTQFVFVATLRWSNPFPPTKNSAIGAWMVSRL